MTSYKLTFNFFEEIAMKNRTTLFASLVIALFLTTIPQAYAGKWYVKQSSGASDANTGATYDQAKLTIQAMINSSGVSSGDTIMIEGGNYQEQVVLGNVSVTLLGSQGNGRTIISAPAWGPMTSYTLSIDVSQKFESGTVNHKGQRRLLIDTIIKCIEKRIFSSWIISENFLKMQLKKFLENIKSFQYFI